MFNKPGTLLTILAVVIVGLAIHLDFTPAPVNNAPSATSFSVPKAEEHLRQIAGKPHSIGTTEKQRVGNYILAQCQSLGLATQTQHSTSVVSSATGVTAGDITDIIAICKGSDSGDKTKPAVLVMAHYDSEPNAGGAGDDGAGCAAMLETARLIKTGPTLKNDIIFLFTDGEEAGLLGSTSFVRENPLFNTVGVALNFDGRGNSGKSFMVSNGSSGWMVDEYRQACAHKSASSLYHELFRILPNSTDLLPFSRKGIPGFDFAYIDGFVNYHALTDQAGNMDPNTFQEQGDNMLSMVRRFGNIDISRRKTLETTFFGVLGNWMIVYPASWNSVFLFATNLLLLVWLIMGMINRRIGWKGFIAGFFSFAVVLALLYFATKFALQGVRTAYPLYGGYYSNAYNTKYFYFAITALIIAIFTLVYQGFLRKFETPSLMAGIALLEVVILDLLYTLIPTAIYFLCFPLLFLLIACLIGWSRRSMTPDTTGPVVWKTSILTFICLLPALLLLAPLIYGLFIGFDVQPEAAALGPLTGLLLGLLIPLFALVFRESRWIIPGCAFLLCLLATGFGVLRGRSTGKPYKTDLRYVVNADDSSAWWVLRNTSVDSWTRHFLPHPVKMPTVYNFPGSAGPTAQELVNKTEFVNFSPPEVTVTSDSVIDGVRKLLLHCSVFDSAVSAHFDLDSTCPALDIAINGVLPEKDSAHPAAAPAAAPAGAGDDHKKYRWLDVRGQWPDGFDVLFELDPKTPFRFHALSRIMGLPAIQGFQGFPPDRIPGPGIFSNTTMSSKYYQFPAP
jgi:hypothetical protein